MLLSPERFEEVDHEEGFGAALNGPNKGGTGETLAGITVPAFSNHFAPASEMADERGLQPRTHSGHPGPIPGWGIAFPQMEILEDNNMR